MQRRQDRIERLIRRLRRGQEWINFGDVADFCAREAGSIAPDEHKRGLAFEGLASALLEGEFDHMGRSHVLFLYSGSKKARMTREWLRDVIDFDYGSQHFLAHCWARRELIEHWFDSRRLPKPDALFGLPVKRSGEAGHPDTQLKLGSNEHKRQTVDAAIEKFGVNALSKMPQKVRDLMIMDFVKLNHGLSVSDRYVRKRLSEAREEHEERNRS
jgi:hypothetical protein